MHPLLHLAASQPQWLAAHAEAYADLVADEIGQASLTLRRRALLGAVGLCGGVVAVALAGVALMLWAVVPASAIHAPWALVLAPLAPALVCAACLFTNGAVRRGTAFATLRQQLKADFVLLRELSGP